MLVKRQQLLYEDTCDIYIPVEGRKDYNTGLVADPRYPASPSYTNIPCLLIMKPEVTQVLKAAIGRFPDDMIFTLDHWHFAEDQDLEVNYAIMLTTPGHSMYGKCWLVNTVAKATPMRARRRSNRKLVYARMINLPPNLSVPT